MSQQRYGNDRDCSHVALVTTTLGRGDRSPVGLASRLATAKRLLTSNPAKAVAHLQDIVRIAPRHVEALRLLGRGLRIVGKLGPAADADRAAIEISAATPELSMALRCLHEDRFQDAETLVRGVLAHQPDDVAATCLLAEIASRVGIYGEAEALYRRAIAAAPDFLDARVNFAKVQFQQNRVDEALATLDAVLAVDPEHFAAVATRLIIYGQTGDYDRAISVYEAMLPQHVTDARFWNDYGNVLKTVNRTDDCVAAFRKAIALDPLLGEAWWGLANLKTRQLDADDIATLRRLLAQPGLSDDTAVHLHFSLGQAFEHQSQYAEAFSHYDAGNRLRRKTLPYDADFFHDEIQRSITFFTPERFAAHRGSGAQSNAPVFILGMPRAGSTLIEQILASHPMVEGTSELPDIPLLVLRLLSDRWHETVSYPGVLADVAPEDLVDLGEAYLAAAARHRKTDRPYFIDKLPNNWAYIGFIQLILPNAIIIDARREAMACCFSNYKQHFAQGQPFSYGLTDMGRYYRDYVDLMEHFDRALPGRIHRVDHERLIAAPELEIPALLAAIGLPPEEACLRFHENTRPVRTASAEQVRRPIDRSAVGQWRHFEPYLAELKTALGDLA